MPYLCNKCSAKYEEHVEQCSKCGGFSVVFVTDEVLSSIQSENFSSECVSCKKPYFGTAMLVHSRSAKMVYMSGVLLAIVFLGAYFFVAVYWLHLQRIPVFFAIFIFPMVVCCAIGVSMKKHRKFICKECGCENLCK